MSSYSRTYNEYLGKNRCCYNKQSTSAANNIGPTGPAGIGPVGPSGINSSIITLLYNSDSSITIPNQYTQIAYYSVTLSEGNALSTINFNLFPSGYQAIVFINGTAGTSSNPCVINSSITNVLTNLSSTINLQSGTGNQGYVMMNIYNGGMVKFCNITGYYN